MRLIILCRETVLLEGLHCLLEALGDSIEVVGTSDSGDEGVDLARATVPDVAVVALSLRGRSGVDTVRELRNTCERVRVLVLVTDPRTEPLREAIEAGAHGSITTGSDAGELARALDWVAAGKGYFSPQAADALLNRYPTGGSDGDPVFSRLTSREREVLRLIADGFGTKEVAHRLRINSKTVDSHRRSVMRKLETDNVPDLVKHAIRAGLSSLEPPSTEPESVRD